MSDEKKHKAEPMLITPPWIEMRALFENVDERMFLDVLGCLADVAPGTTFEDALHDEDGDELSFFSDMGSVVYDTVRIALYSLGVLRPRDGERYSRDLDPDYIDVDPIAARAVLAVVLACDNDMVKLGVAPQEMLEARKKIEALWHEDGARTRWGTAQTRVLTDAELCEQSLGHITHARDMCVKAVLIEITRRWLIAKGLHTATKDNAESPKETEPFKGAITLAQMIPRCLTADEIGRIHKHSLAGCYSCVKCLAPVSPEDIDAGRGARRRYTLDGDNFYHNGVLCAACDKIVEG